MGHELMATSPARYQPDFNDEWDAVPDLDVGDAVRSAQFGEGEVIDVDGLAVTVEFASGQTKKLNTEYARLEKL